MTRGGIISDRLDENKIRDRELLVNLQGANLKERNLRGANLSKTRFLRAKFDEHCRKTILVNENWRDAEFDSEVRKTLENISGSQS